LRGRFPAAESDRPVDGLGAGTLISAGGGAVLTVLADATMPEAFRHGGRAVGLLTVLGYIVAGALSVPQ
jgi:zinc transporter, ZIP family